MFQQNCYCRNLINLMEELSLDDTSCMHHEDLPEAHMRNPPHAPTPALLTYLLPLGAICFLHDNCRCHHPMFVYMPKKKNIATTLQNYPAT